MKKMNLGPMFGGVGVMAAVSLVLSAIFSALISSGVVPVGAMEGLGWGITLVAAFAGAFWVARRAERMPLPMAFGAFISYLLVIFVLRGILFHTVGDKLLLPVLLGGVGTLMGAVLASGMGNGRGKRKKRR